MDWLNYHHLFYFWSVIKYGSVSAAGERLSLAQSTISGQIRALERALGHKLFFRQGRRLELTDMGRVVQRYADEIFALGNELTSALKRRDTGMPTRFLVGVADVIPKLLAAQLLAPIFSTPTHVVCWEDKLDRLLAELTMHGLDMVIADQPFPPTMKGHVHSHMVGQSGVTLLATSALAEQYRRQFPASLDGAPFLLPTSNAALRRSLDDWFLSRNIRPAIRGEFEDSATLKTFGQEGHGIFPATSMIQRDVIRQYKVAVVGQIPSLIQRFYAITVERRLNHPGVLAVIESARRRQKEP